MVARRQTRIRFQRKSIIPDENIVNNNNNNTNKEVIKETKKPIKIPGKRGRKPASESAILKARKAKMRKTSDLKILADNQIETVQPQKVHLNEEKTIEQLKSFSINPEHKGEQRPSTTNEVLVPTVLEATAETLEDENASVKNNNDKEKNRENDSKDDYDDSDRKFENSDITQHIDRFDSDMGKSNESGDHQTSDNRPIVGNNSESKKSDEAVQEKLRRRLPLSIRELIDYHSGNRRSIKEIVSRINQVCKTEEKVSYGYVQKYLYRKRLEATTAKKARYYRKKYGYVYRRMRRKPVLTDHHREQRLQWCGEYMNDHFDKDIFIGKTALKPFLASLNQLKPVQPGQEPEHEPTGQPKLQTTLHLWGAISRRGASPLQIFDGSMTTAMYLEILLENIVPFVAENFPAGHRFHQDNNPKHSAKLSQEFLNSTGINWVKSPPRSHDLNPIELVWTDLIQNVSKRLPKTIGQVVLAVKNYWNTLTPEKCSIFIDNLVETIPKVVENKGDWVTGDCSHRLKD